MIFYGHVSSRSRADNSLKNYQELYLNRHRTKTTRESKENQEGQMGETVYH